MFVKSLMVRNIISIACMLETCEGIDNKSKYETESDYCVFEWYSHSEKKKIQASCDINIKANIISASILEQKGSLA